MPHSDTKKKAMTRPPPYCGLAPEERAKLAEAQRHADEARLIMLPVSRRDLRVLTEALHVLARQKSARARAARKPAADGVAGWGYALRAAVDTGAYALNLAQRTSTLSRLPLAPPHVETHEIGVPARVRFSEPAVDLHISASLTYHGDGRRVHGIAWDLRVRDAFGRTRVIHSDGIEVEAAQAVAPPA